MLSLLQHNCEVTIIDNLDNAFEVVFERMQKLAGDKAHNMKFIKVRQPHTAKPLPATRNVQFPQTRYLQSLSGASECRLTSETLMLSIRHLQPTSTSRPMTLASQPVEDTKLPLLLCLACCACRRPQTRHLHRFDVVVHFAGRKAVGESVTAPMLYYTHNLLGSINLVEAMRKHNCKNVCLWPRSLVMAEASPTSAAELPPLPVI